MTSTFWATRSGVEVVVGALCTGLHPALFIVNRSAVIFYSLPFSLIAGIAVKQRIENRRSQISTIEQLQTAGLDSMKLKTSPSKG